MATEVLMPRQGQSVESCIIIEWKVAEGDAVTEGQALCEVETDKATFEVEATATGTVLGIFYPADADVDVLKVIAAIGEPSEDISSLRPETSEVSSQESEVSAPVEEPKAEEKKVTPDLRPLTSEIAGKAGTGASPRAKNLAAKKGVTISAVAGTGPNGRVIERDVAAAQGVTLSPAAKAKAVATGMAVPTSGTGIGGRVLADDLSEVAPQDIAAAVAALDFPGTVTNVPVRGVRKVIASRMLNSLQTTAQLTMTASADARTMLNFRAKCKAAAEERGVGGITLNDIVLFVTAQTLVDFPELNAHWQGDKIVQFEDVHLGVAVDTPRGLMVPPIRFANRLTLKQISAEAKRLASAAIDGTIEPDALIGGTFTVSNVGAKGVETFTPVLNAPEVGILGVCNIQLKPVIGKGGDTQFIPHIGLSFTFNHCAIDGAPAANFLVAMRQNLAAFDILLVK